MERVYLECHEGQSAKFWEVSVTDSTMTTRWGKIGSAGQSVDKVFASNNDANEVAEKLVNQKKKKHYLTVESKPPTKKAQVEQSVKSRTQKTPPAKKASTLLDPATASKTELVKYAKAPERTSTELKTIVSKFVEVDRVIAKHDRTSQAILTKLSHSSDKATRAAVISNLNVAPKDLIRLGAQFPKAFLANPALDILLIASPELLKAMDVKLLIKIVKQPECPMGFLTWALKQNNEDVQLAISMNQKAYQEILAAVAQSEHPSVRETVRLHASQAEDIPEGELEDNLIKAVTERFKNLTEDEFRDLWSRNEINFAHFKLLSSHARYYKFIWPEEQNQLHSNSFKLNSINQLNNEDCTAFYMNYFDNMDGNHEIIEGRYGWSLWGNRHMFKRDDWKTIDFSNINDNAIKFLSNYHDLMTVTSLDKTYYFGYLENPTCPPTVLAHLATHKVDAVRKTVAEHANTPESTLRLLASDEVSLVRIFVAHNTNTPESTLQVLASDEDRSVRMAVAKHANTAESTLRLLASDEDSYVRMAVAKHANTAESTLRLLASDEDSYVQILVELALNNASSSAFMERLKISDVHFYEEIAAHKNCPLAVLQYIANQCKGTRYEPDMHAVVAANPNYPTSAAVDLVKNIKRPLGQANKVVEMIHAPTVLIQLASDENYLVRWQVAANVNCPSDVLAKLANDKAEWVREHVARNVNCPYEVLSQLAGDKNKVVRMAVANNPNCTIAIITKLSFDPSGEVRALVAANNSTPADILISFLVDKNEAVRLAMAKNPATTAASLEKLTTDKLSKNLRLALAFHPNSSLAVQINALNNKEMVKAIQKHYLPVAVLKDLGESEIEHVREAALSNTNHPQYKDTDGNIMTVSRFFATRLAHWKDAFGENIDGSPWYIEHVKSESPEIQKAIQDNNNFYFGGDDADRAVFSNRSLGAILAVLDGTRVTPERIAKKSKSTDWLLRMAIARNLGTPPNILNRLTTDGRNLVSSQAKSTLKLLSSEEISPKTTDHSYDKSLITKEIVQRIRKANTGLYIRPTLDVWGEFRSFQQSWSVIYSKHLIQEWTNNEWEELARYLLSQLPKNPRDIVEYLSPKLISDQLIRIIFEKEKNNVGVLRSMATSIHTPIEIFENIIEGLLSQLPKKFESARKFLSPMLITDPFIDAIYEKGQNNITVLRIIAGSIGFRRPDVLVKIFNANAKNRNIRLSLLTNSNCPPEVLVQLANDKDELARSNVGGHENCPPELLRKLANDKEAGPRSSVAENENCPFELLRKLANDKVGYVRSTVAANENCPSEVLVQLASDKNSDVRESVAANENCPPEGLVHLVHLVHLASDKDSYVRSLLAEDKNCPPEGLAQLASDKDSDVRMRLAANKNCPPDVLAKLASDKDSDVRMRLAANKNCPPDVLAKLANDKDEKVRSWVVVLSTRQPEILVLLANNKDVDVRKRVIENKSCPPEVLEQLSSDKEYEIRESIAANGNCPPELLCKLANGKVGYVRLAVAANENCPPEGLAQLANDKYGDVRESVAANENCPPEVLERLVHDKYMWVRWRVAANENCPPGVLEQFANDEESLVRCYVALNKNCPPELLRKLANDKDSNVRGDVARNENCPPEVLAQLANDEYWPVRTLVAANENCPPRVLEQLASDKGEAIRKSVAANKNCPPDVLGQLANEKYLYARKGENTPSDVPAKQAVARKLPIPSGDELLLSKKGVYGQLILRSIREPILPTHVTDADLLSGLVAIGCLPKNATNKDLTSASRSKDWLARFAVCLHPDATKSQLTLLMRDSDKNIVSAASSSLSK